MSLQKDQWLPFALAASLATVGCKGERACPEHAACAKQAACVCDGGGRLIRQERDSNGDGSLDRLRYGYDAEGRLVAVDTDFKVDGSTDRHQTYRYDAAGRRVGYAGWMLKCGGEKLRWVCDYERPCSKPFDACAPCRKQFDVEKHDGSLVPCGRQP